MATTIFNLAAANFRAAPDDELVAGDVAAVIDAYVGRDGWNFDDTDEAAIITHEMIMPQGVIGTLKAIINFFMVSDNSNDIALDIAVEAKTPDSDTLDLETAKSWDTLNTGTVSLSGSTAGDPLTLEITLTNKDSVAPGDLVRFAIRRDCDSGNDDASGDLVIIAVEIQEA